MTSSTLAKDASAIPMPTHSLHTLVFRSLKRSADMFVYNHYDLPPEDENCAKSLTASKRREYGSSIVKTAEREKKHGDSRKNQLALPATPEVASIDPNTGTVTMHSGKKNALAITAGATTSELAGNRSDKSMVDASRGSDASGAYDNVKAMLPKRAHMIKKPNWHPPWKLYRVISGHTGWVRCVDVEPGNEWFATGGADRIIKIWDLASGKLKLSLTGHVHTVRGVKVSPRAAYMFSVGEDKTVKCWDLEYNKVIRHYHGHLSGVNGVDLHPTIDVLATCGRDSTVRIWDMRTMAQVHVFSGHTNAVATVKCQSTMPEIISGAHDSTIRLWDLAAGKCRTTLTHHKKSVRALALHPNLNMMLSGSPDNIKQWLFPDGGFVQNLHGHNAIINALAVNQDGVAVSGGDNGSMHFWDWGSGVCYQKHQSKPQPGSIDSEAGIFAMTFDQSHTRLICTESDKTIKMYKEDEDATEESHPILWRPEILKRKQY